jgi:hypothetical protein
MKEPAKEMKISNRNDAEFNVFENEKLINFKPVENSKVAQIKIDDFTQNASVPKAAK